MSVKIIIELDGQEHEVELGDDVATLLESIARRNGLSLGDAVKQALVNEKFLDDQQDSGAKLLIAKDDKVRELVREPAAA